MNELMSYEELKKLGEEIRISNEETGEAITQLALHIKATDDQALSTTTLVIVVLVGLAGWVLRLAFKIAHLQGQIKGK